MRPTRQRLEDSGAGGLLLVCQVQHAAVLGCQLAFQAGSIRRLRHCALCILLQHLPPTFQVSILWSGLRVLRTAPGPGTWVHCPPGAETLQYTTSYNDVLQCTASTPQATPLLLLSQHRAGSR